MQVADLRRFLQEIYLYNSCHWDERRLRNLEITIPIMDTGCIKPIISSVLKSVEFLTPHTGLLISNYICIVIYMYLFSSPQCQL